MARRWAGNRLSQALPSHFKADLFDRAGEREGALRLVVRANRRDRVAADLERLDPVAHHCGADGPLTSRRAVHKELYRRPGIKRAARLQSLGGVFQLDGDLSAR